MTELADFLTTRLDELEDAAKRASDGSGRGRWQSLDGHVQAVDGGDIAVASFVLFNEHRPLMYPHAHHIAMHDPETVLAECDARRRVVDELRRTEPHTERHAGLLYAARCLALPFSAHAEYRQEWKP